MSKVDHKEAQEKEEIEVGGLEVKVKTPPPLKVRPVYHCQTCNASFPSQLDLEEHKKIDHKKQQHQQKSSINV